MTSIIVATVHADYTVAFVGTSQGHLKKVSDSRSFFQNINGMFFYTNNISETFVIVLTLFRKLYQWHKLYPQSFSQTGLIKLFASRSLSLRTHQIRRSIQPTGRVSYASPLNR